MTSTRIVCICVTCGPCRERVVAVYPESKYGEGHKGAWAHTHNDARRWGGPAKVMVEEWPPISPGVMFEVTSEIMQQVQEVTPP